MDAISLREAMRRLVRYTSDAAESLDRRIEEGTLDGLTETEELQETLERVQALGLEVGEEIDACQGRQARWAGNALLTEGGAERLEVART